MAGVNGGGAFVVVYIGAATVVAVPILIAEFLVGRRGRRHPAAAMTKVAQESGRSRRWGLVGGLGVIVAFLILSYYSVIAGWALAYVIPTFSGRFSDAGADTAAQNFASLLAEPWILVAWHALFMALTAGIVARGLKAGIERSIRILMPGLFLALIAVLCFSLVQGDSVRAMHFLFWPDWSKLSGGMLLAAVGQAFFSIGVGMGMMVTYGAYLAPEVSLVRSAFIVVSADTVVAILAGMAIFPLVFANGLDPGEGPGLVFVTLPLAFGSMSGGSAVGGLFFLLLVFAALTSSIAAIEPMVLWVMDWLRWSRRSVAMMLGVIGWVLGIGTVLSFNVWKSWYPLDGFERFARMTLFEVVDYAASNIMMPLGALLIALFVGWRMDRVAACEELGLGDGFHFRVWRTLLLRLVVPAAILGVLIASL